MPVVPVRRRFIPARAGNTAWPTDHTHPPPVHPRAGGEHYRETTPGGTTIGSSPRGRGTHVGSPGERARLRFIPARAGNTWGSRWVLASSPVHPRAGGEHLATGNVHGVFAGSSPRGRGTLLRGGAGSRRGRFIPARAGNTTPPTTTTGPHSVHPRAGGEHSLDILSSTPRTGSSPRGRGTLRHCRLPLDLSRFIPARAGNTPRSTGAPVPRPVHPRAGGEHTLEVVNNAVEGGSSPRGRGTHKVARPGAWRSRFIPARAGNTRPPAFPSEP